MTCRIAPVVVVAGCLAVAGCGGQEQPAAKVTVTVTASPTATASSTKDGKQTTYKIGETSVGTAGTVKVSDYRFRMSHPDWGTGGTDPGMDWAGFHVQVCIQADYAKPIKVGAAYFHLSDRQGNDYANNSQMGGWPSPGFPFDPTKIAPGRCSSGWVAIELPTSARPDRITYGPPSDPDIEWTLR